MVATKKGKLIFIPDQFSHFDDFFSKRRSSDCSVLISWDWGCSLAKDSKKPIELAPLYCIINLRVFERINGVLSEK